MNTLANSCFQYDGSDDSKNIIRIMNKNHRSDFKGNDKYFYWIANNIADTFYKMDKDLTEIPPSDYLALLTGKQLTEREKPCANCKETIAECACMRNICVKCNKPVGNITFSHCDKCFDILHSEPTQESVKERNGDPSMDEMIQLVEQLESDKFHLQQQLKQAKELLKEIDEFAAYPKYLRVKYNQFLTRNK